MVGIETERGKNPGESLLGLANDSDNNPISHSLVTSFVQFYEIYIHSRLGYSKVVLVHLYPILGDIKGRSMEKRFHSLRISSATF